MTVDLDLLRRQIAELLALPLGAALAALLVLVYVFAACRICAKAGFWGPLGFFLALPPLTLFLPLFLAFMPWPVRGQLRQYRRLQKVMKREDRRLERSRPAA